MLSKDSRRCRSERDLFDHLLNHVWIDGDCRVWAGRKGDDGYPRIMHERRQRGARRLMVELLCEAYGEPLRADQHVYAAPGCDNPRDCMAMAHLRIGTLKQMRRAAAARGAYLRGTARSVRNGAARAANARMSMARREEVERMLAEGRNNREIGDHFGVSREAARQAINCWRRLGLLAG